MLMIMTVSREKLRGVSTKSYARERAYLLLLLLWCDDDDDVLIYQRAHHHLPFHANQTRTRLECVHSLYMRSY